MVTAEHQVKHGVLLNSCPGYMPLKPDLRVTLYEYVGGSDSEGQFLIISSHCPILSGPWRRSFPRPKWSPLRHQSLVGLSSSAIHLVITMTLATPGLWPTQKRYDFKRGGPCTNKQEYGGPPETNNNESFLPCDGGRSGGRGGDQSTVWESRVLG